MTGTPKAGLAGRHFLNPSIHQRNVRIDLETDA